MLVSIVTKEDPLTCGVFALNLFDGQKDKKLNTVFGVRPCKNHNSSTGHKRFVSVQPINVCRTSDLLPLCLIR